MCRYCSTETTELRKDGKLFATALGQGFGRAGYTAKIGRWLDNRTRIVMTADKKIRLLISAKLTAPIEFCPKCGRDLAGEIV